MVPFALDLPDEEIGRGPHKFDVSRFNADFAYTMDGSQYGELQYESLTLLKRLLHAMCECSSGSAKNAMVNAIRLGEHSIVCYLIVKFRSAQKDMKAFIT